MPQEKKFHLPFPFSPSLLGIGQLSWSEGCQTFKDCKNISASEKLFRGQWTFKDWNDDENYNGDSFEANGQWGKCMRFGSELSDYRGKDQWLYSCFSWMLPLSDLFSEYHCLQKCNSPSMSHSFHDHLSCNHAKPIIVIIVGSYQILLYLVRDHAILANFDIPVNMFTSANGSWMHKVRWC